MENVTGIPDHTINETGLMVGDTTGGGEIISHEKIEPPLEVKADENVVIKDNKVVGVTKKRFCIVSGNELDKDMDDYFKVRMLRLRNKKDENEKPIGDKKGSSFLVSAEHVGSIVLAIKKEDGSLMEIGN